MDTNLIYITGALIAFFVLIYITRWIFEIRKFMNYQKTITFLLFKAIQKDMSDSEVDKVIKMLEGEMSKEYLEEKK